MRSKLILGSFLETRQTAGPGAEAAFTGGGPVLGPGSRAGWGPVPHGGTAAVLCARLSPKGCVPTKTREPKLRGDRARGWAVPRGRSQSSLSGDGQE